VDVHVHRTTSIVGSRRPRIIPRLVIASIAVALAVQSQGSHASAEPARPGSCASVITTLAAASNGLLMPSESDVAFTPFRWPGAATRRLTNGRLLRLTAHAPDTPVEVVDLEYFFRNVAYHQSWHDPQQAMDVMKFRHLVRVLQRRLTDVRVYRVGTIRIDVYIVGRCGRSLAGLSTTLIET
jgi:hypothetical protein